MYSVCPGASRLVNALDGLLVVAIEQAVAAPLCTARLVSAGARVIKIERPEGDFARQYDTAAKGESSYFTWLNQGKESVCLDFKRTDDAAFLWAMIEQADVLVQNLAPGALARSGFNADQLRRANPRLIVCNISGYGTSGAVSGKRAYDLLVQAESGLVSVSGSANEPGRIGVSICDIGAGVSAYTGILEALLKRSINGRGCELSVSLFDVAAEWMSVPHIHAQYGHGAPLPVGLRHPSIAPYGAFQCADGRLVLVSIQNQREWVRLCEQVLQTPQWVSSQQYATNNDRVANRASLEHDITCITSTLTANEFRERLEDAQIAYGLMNNADELIDHPAFRAQEMITTYGDKINMPAHPIAWSDESVPTGSGCPVVGQHTEQVRNEFMASE